MHSEWSATNLDLMFMHYLIFQFMHSEWSATMENHFPKWQQCNFNSCTPSGVQQQSIVFIFPFILYFVYVILCLIFYTIIFISISYFISSLLARISQDFYVYLRFAPITLFNTDLLQKLLHHLEYSPYLHRYYNLP